MLVKVETPSGTWTTTKLTESYHALQMGCLVDPIAPDAQAFEIRTPTVRVCAFTTGGVNGQSAVDTAIANLCHLSEQHDEELALYEGGALPTWSNGTTKLATAQHGIGALLYRPNTTGLCD